MIYSKSQVASAVKRVNERIADFERKGFTDSEAYDTLYQLAKDLNGGDIVKSKSGHIKIRGTGVKFNESQIKTLMRHGRKNTGVTVGKTIEKTAEQMGLKKNKKNQYNKKDIEKIKREVSKNKEVHDFIEEHKNDIYDVAMLTKAVRKSEKLTTEERDALLEMYNTTQYYDENGIFWGDGSLGGFDEFNE